MDRNLFADKAKIQQAEKPIDSGIRSHTSGTSIVHWLSSARWGPEDAGGRLAIRAGLRELCETDYVAMNDEEEVVLEITPSPVRRWMAILALGLLGILMIKLAFEEMPDLWRLFFVLLGAGILWAAYRLRLATMDGLVLTRAGLRTISGRTLVGVENVARVDRGALAFRPSNGFMVRLKRPGAAGWAPGLWWQIGRRLGVGGTLSGGQAKAMADLLADLVAQREEQGADRD